MASNHRIPRNIRTLVLHWAGREMLAQSHPAPPVFLEIGAMFGTAEGASTFLLAAYARACHADARVVSIEADPEHVAAARTLLDQMTPMADRIAPPRGGAAGRPLSSHVDFRTGLSLDMLPGVLADYPRFDLLWLDGGAHPETCLREFELLFPRLAPAGIALVDDAHEMAPSTAYPHPRPNGKATLILPALGLGRYMANRQQLKAGDPGAAQWASPTLDAIAPGAPFADLCGDAWWGIVSEGRSANLIISRQPRVLPRRPPTLGNRLRAAARGLLTGQ